MRKNSVLEIVLVSTFFCLIGSDRRFKREFKRLEKKKEVSNKNSKQLGTVNLCSRRTTLTGTNGYSEPSSRFLSFERDGPSRTASTSFNIKGFVNGEKANAMFFLREKFRYKSTNILRMLSSCNLQ